MASEDTGWEWDVPSKRYRRKSNGRFLSHTQTRTLRDRFTDAQRSDIDTFVRTYLPATPGEDPVAWATGMRHIEDAGWRKIEKTMTTQYTFGRGGVNAMTSEDRAIVQRLLNGQQSYWQRFMREARAGDGMSVDRVAARATMYTDAATSFYERGREAAFNIELPGMPGDGTCHGLSRCRCSWELVEKRDHVEARWHTGGSDPCPVCVDRASTWSSVRFDRAVAE